MRVHERYREFQADQREIFDALIEDEWETYHSLDWDLSRRFEVKTLFKHVQPRLILDVGCGCGFHDQEMAQYDFVEHVNGIDYSASSVGKANEAYPHAKVRRWVQDFLHHPVTERYDLVVSFQVIEHLEDCAAYFRFVNNSVKAGGHVAVFTPNFARLSNRLRRLRGLPPVHCDAQHFHEFCMDELATVGRAFGLKPVAKFGYGISGLPTWLPPMSMAARLRFGHRVPAVADGLGIIFRAPESD